MWGTELGTLGGRGRRNCGEDDTIVHLQDEEGLCCAREIRACWRGIWGEVENSQPWCPLAVDDTDRCLPR